MVTRATWLPLLYNATREAFESGVSPIRPMYYEYPEEDMAYAADMSGNFAQYLLLLRETYTSPADTHRHPDCCVCSRRDSS